MTLHSVLLYRIVPYSVAIFYKALRVTTLHTVLQYCIMPYLK